MTPQQAKRLAFHQGYSPCPSSFGGFTTDAPQVVPETPNSIPNQEAPGDKPCFNSLSLDDLATFRAVKGSDPLHRADKLAATLHRSRKLNEHFNKEGAQQFLKHYE